MLVCKVGLCYYYVCIPVKILKIHMVKEQALWRKVTERLARRKGECDPGSLNIHRKEWSDFNHLLDTQSGAVLRRRILSWGILTAYKTRGESSLDSEGTG